MAHRLSAVNAASLPEVVGDAGVLLAPSDTEGLAGAMIQILTDDTYHAELRNRAVKQAATFLLAKNRSTDL